jgi:hypothetical protein
MEENNSVAITQLSGIRAVGGNIWYKIIFQQDVPAGFYGVAQILGGLYPDNEHY